MPRLSCDVRNCSNNKSNRCSLTLIEIDGHEETNATANFIEQKKRNIAYSSHQATNAEATCCANFTASSIVASSSPHHPQNEVKVKCSASGCIYNDYYNCTLPDIQISGSTTATCSHDTECSSFVCK